MTNVPTAPIFEDKMRKGKPIKAKNISAYDFLSHIISFSKLPEKELKNLADYCRFETFDSGQYVAHEGDDKNTYGFIVVTGRLAMTKSSINGKELVVELLAPGAIFELILRFSAEPPSEELSARAQLKSKILWVPTKKLASILDSYPNIYKIFIVELIASLQSSYSFSRGLAHDLVQVRIATVLSNLAVKFTRIPPALQEGTIDITRQQLADLTGTTSETAIRVTGAMQRAGLIDIKRPGILHVLNQIDLQKLSEGEDVERLSLFPKSRQKHTRFSNN